MEKGSNQRNESTGIHQMKNELAILDFKLPENFQRSYSEIKMLSFDELPAEENVLNIISRIEGVKTCEKHTASEYISKLASCFHTTNDTRLSDDFFIDLLIDLLEGYTEAVCRQSIKNILFTKNFLPSLAEMKTELDNVNRERLAPLHTAKQYLMVIRDLKPKSIAKPITPAQQKQADKLLGRGEK